MRERGAATGRNSGRTSISSSHLNVAPIQSKRAASRGESQMIEKGMVLPFQPLCLTFRDVNYYVPMPSVRHLPFCSFPRTL